MEKNDERFKRALEEGKIKDDIEYQVKAGRYLDEEYQETGIYHGYNAREAAQRDFEEIQRDYYLTPCYANSEIKTKKVNTEKMNKLKKRAAAIVVAFTLGSGVVFGADVLNHPENYSTTHPEFEGPATFSQIIERTPENFGIGGL